MCRRMARPRTGAIWWSCGPQVKGSEREIENEMHISTRNVLYADRMRHFVMRITAIVPVYALD